MQRKFGILIKRERLKKKWSMTEMVKRLKLYYSPTYIHKIEVLGEIPNPGIICRMAKVLDMDASALLDIAKRIKVKNYSDRLAARYSEALLKNEDK